MLADKAGKLLLGYGFTVVLARYLTPTEFGAFSFALSFVAMFSIFGALGLSGITIRDLVEAVERPADQALILGSVAALKAVGGLMGVALLAVTAWLIIGGDGELLVLTMLIGTQLIFAPANAIELLFQSRLSGRVTAIARTAGVAVSVVVGVVLIVIEKPLIWFALVPIVSAFAQAGTYIGLLMATRASPRMRDWQPNRRVVRSMLVRAWPLIIGGGGAIIYLKIDEVMLGTLAPLEQVGIYAAAARLSELWYVLPAVLGAAWFPELVRLRDQAEMLHPAIDELMRIFCWTGIVIAAIVTAGAGALINMLYGPDYEAAVAVLRVHVWALPFVFMGGVLSKWIIIENMFKFSMMRHIAAAGMNVGLNFALIPRHGASGAALATVLSYALAHHLSCFLDRRSWVIGRQMTSALVRPPMYLVSRILR